ncbi:hypothetical protein JJE62_05370 [Alloprevotella tannerae]|uniref:hypothetical protein n=1 Tax=Alloprevotella tannerae TaxID=76122 RepID=UPI001EDB7E3B|nr:hypothetical protein [Alloprevotella tannerae]MCG2646885.1 hypothetical protein [Alloprevotella tannerae]MCG2648956.1 hypothetical protein [Alloprevotella tannerae]
MKGLVDYLISLDAEIQREIEREVLNINVPYMAEKYKEWMVTIDKKNENVANTYISYIKSADKQLFSSEADFFELLPQEIEAGDIKGVSALFDKYLNVVNEWYELSKDEDYGFSPKLVSDWRSAFRNYRRFIEEWVLPKFSGKKNDMSDTQEANVYKRLFAEEEFLHWLTTTDKKGKASAQSYISRLKRLNRTLSQAISAKSQTLQDGLFSLIPTFLKAKEEEKVVNLLTSLDEKLIYLIRNNDSHWMPIPSLRDSLSALRKYGQFINEEYINGDSTDEEEPEEEETTDISLLGISGVTNTYGHQTLKNNFRFRLITQNRMSESKDVFYPIKIIKRLFRLSSKAIAKHVERKDDYNWFNKWIDDCIAEIQVMTDKGSFILAELSENDTIIINPTTKEVTVTLLDGTTARMLTQTEEATEPARFMEISQLCKIHIDHTPLICNLLSENISNLPAMVRLTEIIREVAKENNLSIVRDNFSTIASKVMKSEKHIVEMLEMIPTLKNELEFIRSKSTLCLMDAKYNLRKKK